MKQYAAKVFKKEQLNSEIKGAMINEISLLRRLSYSPNVSTLLRVYESKAEVVMLFNLYKGGSLNNIIKDRQSMPESIGKNICIQLLLAADLLQKANIIHRDFKPDNILI